MKSSFAIAFLLVVIALLMVPAIVSQKAEPGATVPKYDPATESTFKGAVVETLDRQCPISGGLGSHLILKLVDGATIEAHLATTKFVKSYELVFHKGDKVEIIGTKLQFEGKDTIFAREIKRGDETFVFRDQKGGPIW